MAHAEAEQITHNKIAAIKDMIAGCAAGCISKTIEYPLDTLKVLMQISPATKNSSKVHNPINVFTKAMAEGGILRLYRGLSAPVFGSSIEFFITFWLFGAAERAMKSHYKTNNLTISQIGYCGAFSGIGIGLWLTPIEFIKCQMQVSHTAAQYNGSPTRCFMYHLRHQPKNLLTGLNASLLREIPGTFIYFVTYRSCLKFLTNIHNNRQYKTNNQKQLSILKLNWKKQNKNNISITKESPFWAISCSGGIAGLTFWTLFYPIDLIKSQLQTQNKYMSNISNITNHRINKLNGGLNTQELIASSSNLNISESTLSLLLNRYKTHGFRSLFNGWSVTAVRATMTNAVIFTVYEYTKHLLNETL